MIGSIPPSNANMNGAGRPESGGPEDLVTIGVEMEVFADLEVLRFRLSRLIPDIVGKPVHEGGASLSCDRSVDRVQKRASEIRTPIMRGLDHALDLVGRLTQALAVTASPMPSLGNVRPPFWLDPEAVVHEITRIKRTCGLHVHVGVPENVTWIDGLAAVLDVWLADQNRMMAEAYGQQWWSNRAYLDRMHWCFPWAEALVFEVAASREPERERNHPFNPMAIRKHRTIEYRMWPMSLDPERVKHAVRTSVEHALTIDWDRVRNGESRRRLQEIHDWAKAKREEIARRFHEDVMENYRAITRESGSCSPVGSRGRNRRRKRD